MQGSGYRTALAGGMTMAMALGQDLAAVERTTRYVTNAIDALAVCCRISPLFTDVVQLLNLFFEHADQEDVFEQSKYCISQLSDDLLLQASSQLLVQLSHPSEKVAQFVHDIMLELLDEHYHGLIFSLIVNTFSKNIKRATASQKLYDEFSEKHPEESEEIITKNRRKTKSEKENKQQKER